MQNVDEAELSVGPKAIDAYSRLSYTMWFALAEFVDNSTQSRLNYGNLIDEVLQEEGRPLTVSIVHERPNKTLTIEDNSIGMSKDDLVAALRIAHPTPERVADIGATALTKRRYSRSKATYLMNAAGAVAKGELDAEGLPDGSAVAAEKRLTALRGVGTWTARYFMLRGGFADAAPVGDSALATALQKLHNRAERPEHDEVHKMLLDFAPYRSLATLDRKSVV